MMKTYILLGVLLAIVTVVAAARVAEYDSRLRQHYASLQKNNL